MLGIEQHAAKAFLNEHPLQSFCFLVAFGYHKLFSNRMDRIYRIIRSNCAEFKSNNPVHPVHPVKLVLPQPGSGLLLINTACKESAVDDQHLAGHKTCRFGREENRCTGKFLDLSEPSHWRPHEEFAATLRFVEELLI